MRLSTDASLALVRSILVQLGTDLRHELFAIVLEVTVEFGHLALVHHPNLGRLRVEHLPQMCAS